MKERLEAIANGSVPLAPTPAPVNAPVQFESPASPANFEGLGPLDPGASFLAQQPGEMDMEIESDTEDAGGGGRHKHSRAGYRPAAAGANPADGQTARALEPGLAGTGVVGAGMNMQMQLQQPITIPLVAAPTLTQLQPQTIQNPYYAAMPGSGVPPPGLVGAPNGPLPGYAPNAMMPGAPIQMSSPPGYALYAQPPPPHMAQFYSAQVQGVMPGHMPPGMGAPQYAGPYPSGPSGYPMPYAAGPGPGPIFTGAPPPAMIPHSAAPPPQMQVSPASLPSVSFSHLNAPTQYANTNASASGNAIANAPVSSAAAPPPAAPSVTATANASKPSVHELIQRLLSKPNPPRAPETSSVSTSASVSALSSSMSSLAASLVSTLTQASIGSRAPPPPNPNPTSEQFANASSSASAAPPLPQSFNLGLFSTANQNQIAAPPGPSGPATADEYEGEHTPLTAESDPSAVHTQASSGAVSAAAQWQVAVTSTPLAAPTTTQSSGSGPQALASPMSTWPRPPSAGVGAGLVPPTASPMHERERGPPLLGAAPRPSVPLPAAAGYRPPAPAFNPNQNSMQAGIGGEPELQGMCLPPPPPPAPASARIPLYSPTRPPVHVRFGAPLDPFANEALQEAGSDEYDPTVPLPAQLQQSHPTEDFVDDYQMKVRAFDNAMRQQLMPARGSGNGRPPFRGKRRSFADEPTDLPTADSDMRTESWLSNSPPNNGGPAPGEPLPDNEGFEGPGFDEEGLPPPPVPFLPRGAPGQRRPRGGREFRGGGRLARGGRGGGPRFGGPQFPMSSEFDFGPPPEMMLEQPPYDAFGPPPPFFGPPQQQNPEFDYEYDPMMEQPPAMFSPRGPPHKTRMRPPRGHSPRHSAPFFRPMQQQMQHF